MLYSNIYFIISIIYHYCPFKNVFELYSKNRKLFELTQRLDCYRLYYHIVYYKIRYLKKIRIQPKSQLTPSGSRI